MPLSYFLHSDLHMPPISAAENSADVLWTRISRDLVSGKTHP
jgi:hypothetical protein